MGFYIICLLPFFHPFEKDIVAANSILLNKIEDLQKINSSSNVKPQEALSIVFPEMIRWNNFQDLMETKSLELAYVKLGRKGADFSIGHFQMKPSFVEQLEDYISRHQNLKKLNYVLIVEKKQNKARKIRLYRLKNFTWQVRYAHVYWLVANDRFKYMKFKTPEERIHFFASAYNYGFRREDKKIKEWQKLACFPYGSKYKGEQVKYADLSLEFYQKYSHKYK